MSADPDRPYRFPEGVPVGPIARGTTVLVAGSSLSPAEDLARTMVANDPDGGDGVLFVSTGQNSETLVADCQRLAPEMDASRLGIIDCSGQDVGPAHSGPRVKYVSTQSDLTGIGMRFSALYESLYADAVDGRVRTGLLSLSSLSMYVDLRQLFKFGQTLSSRIGSAGGLGVFAMDPSTHDEQTVNTLGHVADGRIEVREPQDAPDADGELRVRGLRDQPDGWRPFDLP